MKKRNLPTAHYTPRDIQFGVSPSALKSWNPGLRMEADAAEADNVISILDVIGEDPWFGGGWSARRMAGALRNIGADKDVFVDINSPGGNFFEGLAIYNMLRQHKGQVTVRVLGIAASAASVIAMAGDEVQVARSGFLMIHNTWVMMAGDRHDMRETAEWLEPFDSTAVDLYAARSGMDAKKIAAMMDRETWISGKDAVEQGFADDFLSVDRVEQFLPEEKAGLKAQALLDNILAKAGVPRSERRNLVSALKSGTPRAADPVTPSADEVLSGVLEKLNALTAR